jgi:hypothetical protein
MVALVALCGTRIRYTHLLIHLVGGNLACVIEEGGDLSGSRFHGVADLVQSTRVIGFMLEASNQFKSLVIRHRCYGDSGSSIGRWMVQESRYDIYYTLFKMFYTSYKLME